MQPTHLIRFLSRTQVQEFMVVFVKADGQPGLFSVVDVATNKTIGLWDKSLRQYTFSPEHASKGYIVEDLAHKRWN